MSLAGAVDAYDRGEYDRARILCQTALVQDLSLDDRIAALAYLGYALVKLGEQQGANEAFRRALALQPAPRWRVNLHYQLGVGLRETGESEEARLEFQKAIERFEEPADEGAREELVKSLVELAVLEYDRGDYAAALACVERGSRVSISAGPENRASLIGIERLRGKALSQLGRWGECIPILRNALALLRETDADTQAELMSFLGLALCAVREFDEAIEVLQATAVDPGTQPGLWIAARIWLGKMYHWKYEYAKALGEFEAVVRRPAEEWKDFQECLASLSDCYFETGNSEKGFATAEKAYRKMPENGQVRIAYVRALGVVGRYQEAEQMLREMDEVTLDEATREQFYSQSCYVAAGLGDRKRAEQWLDKLIGLKPNSRHLARLRPAMEGMAAAPRVSQFLTAWKRWRRGG